MLQYIKSIKQQNGMIRSGSSLICKEGCRFSMGWCMREPYCPLSSAVCNATIPTLPLFKMAESACSPFCYVLHYLLFISLHTVCFISSIRDWTVPVAQYSKFACSSKVYLKIWLYNNFDMFTYLTMIFN
jgi:hypothetical protein